VTATSANPQDVLRDEILADAKRQEERILRRAKQEADDILAKAKAEAEKEQRERLEAARAEAQRRRDLILGTVPVEVGRMRSARIEAALESVREETARRLAAREGLDYREALVSLAAAAIASMDGRKFVIALSAADRQALGDGWLEDVRRRAGRDVELSIAPEPAGIQTGLIVSDADGRRVCDQSFAARLARLWPQVRPGIAVAASLIQRGGSPKES